MSIESIKTVIIEDEKEDMYLMKNLLSNYSQIEIIATANDGNTNSPAPMLAATVTMITPIRLKERLI